MEVAFAPGFLRGLGQLPVAEAGAKAGGYGLGMLRPVVVAEAVVGKSKGFREQPAFAIVLIQEGFDTLLPVTTAGANLVFKVMEGDEGQNCVAELWRFVLVNAPEALGIVSGRNR